jgi:nucleoside-diphosphate-sugar epimerase
MSSVLITGAPGWLGNTLLESMDKSTRSLRLIVDPIYANSDLKALLPAAMADQIEIASCDLRDSSNVAKNLKDVQTVFHLAAVQHPKRVSEIYAINSDATGTLARLAASAGVEKFVFVSSGIVQGVNTTSEPTNELTQTGKIFTHYGFSKLKAEALVQDVREKTGLHVVIVRPGVFYGRRASANMRRFLKMIQTKRLPLFGKDGFRRSYVDVQKVAEALLLAEEKGRSGNAYVISDNQALDTRELYETLAEALGCRPRLVNVPVTVARMAEKAAFYSGCWLDRHLSTANIIGEFGRPNFYVSVRDNEIGFKPLASPRPGLNEMAAAFLRSGG